MAQIFLGEKKRTELEDSHFPNFETYYTAKVIKTVWHWLQDRHKSNASESRIRNKILN